jgi:hypothetical protein
MAEVKKNERFIPTKNYIIAFVLIIGVIAASWYAFAWYKTIQENKLSKSYLVSKKVITNEIESLDKISDILSEAPSQYYLYISYTGTKEIYSLEKGVAKVIKEYNLKDSFYYLNISDIKDDKNYIQKINKALGLEENTITSIPNIVYYEDGQLVDIINKSSNMMTVGDFQKTLDIHKIEKDR